MVDKGQAFLKVATAPIGIMNIFRAVKGDQKLAILRIMDLVEMVDSAIGNYGDKYALG